jgi:hypothetical protein
MSVPMSAVIIFLPTASWGGTYRAQRAGKTRDHRSHEIVAKNGQSKLSQPKPLEYIIVDVEELRVQQDGI